MALARTTCLTNVLDMTSLAVSNMLQDEIDYDRSSWHFRRWKISVIPYFYDFMEWLYAVKLDKTSKDISEAVHHKHLMVRSVT